MKQIVPKQFIISVIWSNINSLTIMKLCCQKLPRYDSLVSKLFVLKKNKQNSILKHLSWATQINWTRHLFIVTFREMPKLSSLWTFKWRISNLNHTIFLTFPSPLFILCVVRESEKIKLNFTAKERREKNQQQTLEELTKLNK